MTKDKGWIKLPRQIEKNPLYYLEPFTKIQAWIDLLLKANEEDKFVKLRKTNILVKKGQVGMSEETMARNWQWSRNKVRRFLKILETKQVIEQVKVSKITTLITILEYENYQAKQVTKQVKGNQKKQKKPNPVISDFLFYLKNRVNIIDTPVSFQRKHTWIFILKMRKIYRDGKGHEPTDNEVLNGMKYVLNCALEDKFHSTKAGNIRYLYNNIGAITKSCQNNNNNMVNI